MDMCRVDAIGGAQLSLFLFGDFESLKPLDKTKLLVNQRKMKMQLLCASFSDVLIFQLCSSSVEDL